MAYVIFTFRAFSRLCEFMNFLFCWQNSEFKVTVWEFGVVMSWRHTTCGLMRPVTRRNDCWFTNLQLMLFWYASIFAAVAHFFCLCSVPTIWTGSQYSVGCFCVLHSFANSKLGKAWYCYCKASGKWEFTGTSCALYMRHIRLCYSKMMFFCMKN